MKHLHRELAPISSEAWEEIDAEAARTLRRTLAGRKLVDFKGPLGWDRSAEGRGRTQRIAAPREGVEAALRLTRPLVEIEAPFVLPRAEIDAIARGARDADLQNVVRAARSAALTEDQAIFRGFAAAGIEGLFERGKGQALTLTDDYEKYPQVVATALTWLRNQGIEGPYAIALGPRCYEGLTETTNRGGYPVINMVMQQLDGRIVWAPAVDGAVIMSLRGGDFELVVGQDFAIGYRSHDAGTVTLYLQESFTFAAYNPEAAVPLQYGTTGRLV
ncbi:MAG TPA: family 1 encapsulin nanocompartment shell protein [Gammaproteobacteria bacterium]|nr:family 1 encapsulin nanocompartment shell protein [Gammaproteobacteria bacterium]